MPTSHPMFPDLETERLLLRAPGPQDVDFLLGHFRDPEVTRFLLDCPPLADRAAAEALAAQFAEPAESGPNRWCLVRKSDGRPVGTCGYHCWSRAHRRAEVGYDLSPAAWGQGLMTEALRCVLDHGKQVLALYRIEALVYGDNVRSTRLLERLGFQREGTLRGYFHHAGAFHDHLLYALVGDDR